MSHILYISFAYTCHFLLCFISVNTLEEDTGNNCMYSKGTITVQDSDLYLYIPEGIIIVRDSDLCHVICDLNGSYILEGIITV